METSLILIILGLVVVVIVQLLQRRKTPDEILSEELVRTENSLENRLTEKIKELVVASDNQSLIGLFFSSKLDTKRAQLSSQRMAAFTSQMVGIVAMINSYTDLRLARSEAENRIKRHLIETIMLDDDLDNIGEQKEIRKRKRELELTQLASQIAEALFDAGILKQRAFK